MDIVVDASTLIAVIANEPDKEHIILATRGANLMAPISVHFEVGNAFSAMLKRRRITLNQCLDALELYDSIPVRMVDIELEISIQIAARLGIYAYDAYLIRCGERYRAPILSLDRALREHARSYGVQVLEIER
jgi:predicted nucleic acid-binding protein